MRGAIVGTTKGIVLRLESGITVLHLTWTIHIDGGTIIQCWVGMIASKLGVGAWGILRTSQRPFTPAHVFTGRWRRWNRRWRRITGATFGITRIAKFELKDTPANRLNVTVVIR